MNYWQDKVVLITGGSAGFGFALARAFANRGANLVIAGRDSERLSAAEISLRETGREVLPVACDVTRAEQVESLFEQAVNHFGHLHVLVNNAGRSTRGSVVDATADEFQSLMDINFLSVVRCTRAAMPHLVQSKGHLVNIGSLAAKTAAPFMGVYAASKFALAAYTQQWRIEGPSEVHFLLVCTGPIDRPDAGTRYDQQSDDLPEEARRPGGGAKLKTIPPAKLAKWILRACEQRRTELVVPNKARGLFAISQLWPALGDLILRRWT